MLKHRIIVSTLLRQRDPRQSFERMLSLQRNWPSTLQQSISRAVVGLHTNPHTRSFFSRFYSDSNDDANSLKPNSKKYAFYDLDGEPPA